MSVLTLCWYRHGSKAGLVKHKDLKVPPSDVERFFIPNPTQTVHHLSRYETCKWTECLVTGERRCTVWVRLGMKCLSAVGGQKCQTNCLWCVRACVCVGVCPHIVLRIGSSPRAGVSRPTGSCLEPLPRADDRSHSCDSRSRNSVSCIVTDERRALTGATPLQR